VSTREKRHGSSKSGSRRHQSLDMSGGLMSPPPEEMSAKAAKVLGVGAGLVGVGIGLSRSASKRSKKGEDDSRLGHKTFANPAPAEDDDDIVMVGAADATPAAVKPERRRPSRVSCSPISKIVTWKLTGIPSSNIRATMTSSWSMPTTRHPPGLHTSAPTHPPRNPQPFLHYSAAF
jgi:hypothetical protein